MVIIGLQMTSKARFPRVTRAVCSEQTVAHVEVFRQITLVKTNQIGHLFTFDVDEPRSLPCRIVKAEYSLAGMIHSFTIAPGTG